MVSIASNSSLLLSLPNVLIKQKAKMVPLHIKPSNYLLKPLRFTSFKPFTALEESVVQEDSEEEPSFDNESSDDSISVTEEELPSAVLASLQSYKKALESNDIAKIDELEAFLLSLDNEKNSIADKVTALSGSLLIEKDRILRISADFDNFRKRTEIERLSLMDNVQGDVVEGFLPVIDSFERAKVQIKAETEGEEKINSSYQSIYKQLLEILTSLGVKTVETLGIPFDPMLHEAIMREDSSDFEEGIITQEFRKGFKLGEKLLRPSMVKVSAGPGPAKLEEDDKETNKETADEDKDPVFE